MKKTAVVLMMCLILVATLCGCGASKKASSPLATDPLGSGEDTNVITTGEGDVDKGILTGTYKVPLNEIYVDTPNFKRLEEGYVRIFLDGGMKYVTFTCLYNNTAESLEDAHKQTIETVLIGIGDHHLITSLGDISGTTTQVNGIEAYAFEGTLIAGYSNLYDAYIYGYSFIYQGFPCSILGVVMDKSQPEEEKQLVKEIVDAMMISVRDKR